MTGGVADAARRALKRQARQSALAFGIAALGLLVMVPLAALVRPIASSTRERFGVPFDEVPALVAISTAGVAAIDEMINVMMGGRPRPWLIAGVVVVQFAAWTVIAAVAKMKGAESIGAAGIAFGALVHVLSRALAVFLKPLQRCDARLRRTVRELKMSPIRISSFGAGLSVILYVYLTVFTQLDPAIEVLVMGFGMPLLQAVLMAASSRLMLRQERRVVVHAKLTAVSTDVSTDEVSGDSESHDTGSKPGSPTRASASRDHVSLVMVLIAETLYSTGAFATLALAESSYTFFISLAAMQTVEIVQVALHVKARRVVSQVVTEGRGVALLCDDTRLRQWLLHRELGEKVGVLVALGYLVIAKAASRGAMVVDAISTMQLARRGLAMVLAGLIGDLCKDFVSQALGLASSDEGLGRVSLSAFSVGIAVLASVDAGFGVQIGLTLGSAR